MGDDSVHACAYGQCSFEILIGEYLVTGWANRFELMDELYLEPIMLPVLEEIADSVRRAIPSERPRWVAPEVALDGWGHGCDERAPIDELGAIVGIPNPYSTGSDWGLAQGAIFDLTKPSWCTLASEDAFDSYLQIVVLEGGGWVESVWATNPPTTVQEVGLGAYEPISVDGWETAYFQADAGGGYYTLLGVLHGSLISFSTGAESREQFLDWSQQVAELLLARDGQVS